MVRDVMLMLPLVLSLMKIPPDVVVVAARSDTPEVRTGVPAPPMPVEACINSGDIPPIAKGPVPEMLLVRAYSVSCPLEPAPAPFVYDHPVFHEIFVCESNVRVLLFDPPNGAITTVPFVSETKMKSSVVRTVTFARPSCLLIVPSLIIALAPDD